MVELLLLALLRGMVRPWLAVTAAQVQLLQLQVPQSLMQVAVRDVQGLQAALVVVEIVT